MSFKSIIERELMVEILRSGECRKLVIKIGYPFLISTGEYYECPVDYGWLADEPPTEDLACVCVNSQGVDPVHALLRALDMINGFGLLNSCFKFYLPNGALLFNGKYDLSRFMHKLCEEYFQEKKKDESLTIERFQYTRVINHYQKAIADYREMLKENDME